MSRFLPSPILTTSPFWAESDSPLSLDTFETSYMYKESLKKTCPGRDSIP